MALPSAALAEDGGAGEDPIALARRLASRAIAFDEWQTENWERISASVRARRDASSSKPAAVVEPALKTLASEVLVAAGDQALAAALQENAGAEGGSAREAVASALRRAEALETSELGRLSGRLGMDREGVEGAFESEGVKLAASQLVEAGAASPSYRVYCRWRAYNEALAQFGPGGVRSFAVAFDAALLRILLSGGEPPKARPETTAKRDAKSLRAGLPALLEGCRRTGLLAAWSLDLDEDEVEMWEDRVMRALSFEVSVEGYPFDTAEVVLADRRDSLVPNRDALVPQAVSRVVLAWLRSAVPGVKEALAETYYPYMRYAAAFGPTEPGPNQVKIQVRLL